MNNFKFLVLFLLLVCTFPTGSSASESENDLGIENVDEFEPKSESEIWAMLFKSCETKVTNKCRSNRMEIVSQGGVYEDDQYDEETAFKSKNEVIEAAKAALAVPPDYE